MIDKIIDIFKTTVKFMEESVGDVTDQQMVEQPDSIKCHAAWTLGHIIYSCQGMATELGAEPWLPNDWESKFGYGSTPILDIKQYPNKSKLLDLLNDSSNLLVQTIQNADIALLEKSLPDETFPTMQHLLLQVVVAHTAYHAGQLTSWRKTIGKEPIGVFV